MGGRGVGGRGGGDAVLTKEQDILSSSRRCNNILNNAKIVIT